MDSLPFAERASVPSNHAHFFPTEARVLDRHAEERVFIFLVIGCEGILVEQNQFRVIRAGFRELWKLPSDRGDQAGLSLHAFIIGHRLLLSQFVVPDPPVSMVTTVTRRFSVISL